MGCLVRGTALPAIVLVQQEASSSHVALPGWLSGCECRQHRTGGAQGTHRAPPRESHQGTAICGSKSRTWPQTCGKGGSDRGLGGGADVGDGLRDETLAGEDHVGAGLAHEGDQQGRDDARDGAKGHDDGGPLQAHLLKGHREGCVII